MRKSITLFIFALLAGAGIVKAQQNPDTTARHFLIDASIINLQEIAAGKLATQQGTTPNIKSFGKMMIDDHNKAEAQLLSVAKSQGIMLPPASTEMPVADLNLKKAQGQNFDRMYVHAMEAGHRSAAMMFQDYAISGKSPAVKTYAAQTLTTIKGHLQMITDIDNKMKYPPAK